MNDQGSCIEYTPHVSLEKYAYLFFSPFCNGNLVKTVHNITYSVFKKLDWKNTGLRVNEEYLSPLTFADDIVLISDPAEHLQKMLEELL